MQHPQSDLLSPLQTRGRGLCSGVLGSFLWQTCG